MTPSRTSDTRPQGLVDYPDGTDWKCSECGATVPDSEELEHGCDGQLERVNRAYIWPGGRNDVVIEYAYVGEEWEAES